MKLKIFAMLLVSAAIARGGTLTAERAFAGRYVPGSTLGVTVTIKKAPGNLERITGLYLAETLPVGWTLDAVTSTGHEPLLAPVAGTNKVEMLWVKIPVFPCTVTYRVRVPASAGDNQVFTGKIKWTVLGDPEEVITTGDHMIGSLADHSADIDKDSVISRGELDRVVELYLAGEHHISTETDDGFEVGAGLREGFAHDSDFAPADWTISMRKELFRAVQLYNAGGYHYDPTTPDRFAPTDFKQYMVIDLSDGPEAFRYPITYIDDIPGGAWSDEYKTTKLVLRRIPKGTFTMGAPFSEGFQSDETQHEVTLTQDFYIGVFEVTQAQWELVMGENPSFFTNNAAMRPVEQANYGMIRGSADWPASNDVSAGSFMGRIRARVRLPGFDLPTEAQWEYACRAGEPGPYNVAGNPYDDTMMRYINNSGAAFAYPFPDRTADVDQGTAIVGSYDPNAWGLYDMHGNVFEWCLDWYGAFDATEENPPGAASGVNRIRRGGSWTVGVENCRSAYRGQCFPSFNPPSYTGDDMGFRPVWPLPAKK